jgi:plasmid maintenance system antidote protein VapI
MVNLKSVVDKGAEVCGGQANLARQLGVTPQRLDDWKRGRVPITPESAAKMGLLAGLDGEQVRMLAAQVIIDNPKNEGSREVLRRAFFGAILTGAVGILLLFGNTSNAYAAHADNFTVYTLWAALGAVMALRARSNQAQTTRGRRPRAPTRALGAAAPLVIS